MKISFDLEIWRNYEFDELDRRRIRLQDWVKDRMWKVSAQDDMAAYGEEQRLKQNCLVSASYLFKLSLQLIEWLLKYVLHASHLFILM